MPTGVLTNCGAVLLGGLLGTLLGKVLPETLKEHLPTMFGLSSIGIGVNSIIKASSMTAVVLAILVAIMNASGIKNRANKMTEGCDGCCASCSSSCDKKEG